MKASQIIISERNTKGIETNKTQNQRYNALPEEVDSAAEMLTAVLEVGILAWATTSEVGLATWSDPPPMADSGTDVLDLSGFGDPVGSCGVVAGSVREAAG